MDNASFAEILSDLSCFGGIERVVVQSGDGQYARGLIYEELRCSVFVGNLMIVVDELLLYFFAQATLRNHGPELVAISDADDVAVVRNERVDSREKLLQVRRLGRTQLRY